MAESKRLEAAPTSEAADRDSRAEALLVEGLDRYFAGRYEDAIHVWTRVLFLDRSHARARAYIDRARTALAERHRRGDELIHSATTLLAEGQIDRARTLLVQLEAMSGDDQHTAALLAQLDRVERLRASGAARPAPAVADAVRLPSRRRMTVRHVVTGALIATSASLLALATVLLLEASFGWGRSTQPMAGGAPPATLPVLSSSDVALVRARTLYARGRLAEALVALDRVDREHPGRAEADRLRIDIQRVLLGTGGPAAGAERGPE
jgi:hypothetical protein